MVVLWMFAVSGCSTAEVAPEVQAAEIARRRKAKAIERLRELEPTVCEDPTSDVCKRVTATLLEADMQQ